MRLAGKRRPPDRPIARPVAVAFPWMDRIARAAWCRLVRARPPTSHSTAVRMAACAASFESESNPPAPEPTSFEPRRVRLVAVRAHRAPSGQCRAEVELQRSEGDAVVGRREGHAIALGDLRIVAEATLDALHRAATTGHRFELLGVKTVRAFDETVVLAQVAVVEGRGPSRLVGAAMCADDLPRAAVLAVLNATNRVLGHLPD
jgi:hypothetical protein